MRQESPPVLPPIEVVDHGGRMEAHHLVQMVVDPEDQNARIAASQWNTQSSRGPLSIEIAQMCKTIFEA